MINIYRKITAIQAEQFDGSKRMAKRYGAELYSESGYGYDAVEGEPDGDGYVIDTLEGELLLRAGDWIATGVNGEHWPIADDVFRKTYAELPVIPKCVADWIEECKRNDQAIASAFDETLMSSKTRYYFCNYSTRSQWISIQDAFVRAWLDGYRLEEQHD